MRNRMVTNQYIPVDGAATRRPRDGRERPTWPAAAATTAQPRAGATGADGRAAGHTQRRSLWSSIGPLEFFLFAEIACQVALLLPSVGPSRVAVRAASLGLGLVYL